MKFLADSMMGKVARRMRMLGYDTEYHADDDADAVLKRAVGSDRTIITASPRMSDMASAAHVDTIQVRTDNQNRIMGHIIRQANLVIDISIERARCTICNGYMKDAMVSDGEVPPMVRNDIDRFRRCSRCGHLYWEGTHMKNLRAEAVLWR